MTQQPRAFVPAAKIGPSKLSWIDRGLVFCAVMTACVIFGIESTSRTLPVIGLYLSTTMAACVPAFVAIAPLRIAYLVLRQSCGSTVSCVTAAMLSVLTFYSVHLALIDGPSPNLALGFLADEHVLTPVTRPADGVVSILFTRDGEPWVDQNCGAHCQMLLRAGLADEVALLSSHASLAPAVRFRRVNAANCPVGMTRAENALDICALKDPEFRPSLTYVITLITQADPRYDSSWPIQDIHRVHIRSGAMSQTVHIVRAAFAQGGGLIAPVSAAWRGDEVRFTADRLVREFASFASPHTEAPRQWQINTTLPRSLGTVFTATLADRNRLK